MLGLALLLAACSPKPVEPGASVESVLGACASGSLAEAKCGLVEVEENRAEPNGRTIELSVVVAPSTSRTPAADPVFLLAGGPGQGAAALAPMLLHRLAPLRAERDIVFVDVRGTGDSNPLACDIEEGEDITKLLGAEFDFDKLDTCLAAYEQAGGVDLTQYTTANIVDDLDEVRARLGYDQINLLGISYGSLVAQIYMRRHEASVRSVILDGIVPHDRPVALAQPGNAEHALKLLLADCRQASDCAAALPGLERKLLAVLEDLDSNRGLEQFEDPRTGELLRADITRNGFTSTMIGALYSGGLTSLLPLAIERAHVGDYGPIAAIAAHMGKHAQSLSMGLYLSVGCAGDLAALNETSRREAVEGLDVFNDENLALLERACASWPHAEPEAPGAPLSSIDVPTLMFSGRYDPVTPPMYGEHLLEQLAHARHIEVASASHGTWNHGCTMRLMADFFASADLQAVDPSCHDTLARPLAFLNANGPSLLQGQLDHNAPLENNGPALASGEAMQGEAR